MLLFEIARGGDLAGAVKNSNRIKLCFCVLPLFHQNSMRSVNLLLLLAIAIVAVALQTKAEETSTHSQSGVCTSMCLLDAMAL